LERYANFPSTKLCPVKGYFLFPVEAWRALMSCKLHHAAGPLTELLMF
jgi:hypothetical protein